jgi:hypothetical protein
MKTGQEGASRAHWCICVSWDWLKDNVYYIFAFYSRFCFVFCPFPYRVKDIVSWFAAAEVVLASKGASVASKQAGCDQGHFSSSLDCRPVG